MNKSYTLEVVDADDGSGDKVIQFTEEFLKESDWQADDEILFKVGSDGSIEMRNLSWEKRQGK